MKLIPTRNLIYKTSLPTNEIISRLQQNIEPYKLIKFTAFKKITIPFQGEIKGNRFKLIKNISGRNSFQARVEGIVEQNLVGSKITVSMAPHSFIKTFMLIWLIGVGGFCLLTIFVAIFDSGPQFSMIIPFLMLIFGFLLPKLGFTPDANDVQKKLQELFNATVEENIGSEEFKRYN